MYLVDLIAWSNGFVESASPVVYLYRRKPESATQSAGGPPTDEAIRIDLQALNEGRNPEQNYKLRGGDILYVPQAAEEYFFLLGDVHTPARHRITGRGLMASRALALGGGPLKTAKLGKAVLVRLGQDGIRQEVPLDFEAIFRGTKPDVGVQTGDIIYVPGSLTKSLAYAMTAIVPGTFIRGLGRLQQ
jgi:protein involved in polysaccharide export with SLBB domain